MQPLIDIENLKTIRINHARVQWQIICDIAMSNYDNLVAMSTNENNRLRNISVEIFLTDGRDLYRIDETGLILATSSTAASSESSTENSSTEGSTENSTSSSSNLVQGVAGFGVGIDEAVVQNVPIPAQSSGSDVSSLIDFR